MANLEKLVTVGSREVYANEATVDAGEQNTNEDNLRAGINATIQRLNDGSVVETGKAQTFGLEQTFTNGIKTNTLKPLTAGQPIVVDDTSGTDLYKGSSSTSNKYQTGSEVDAKISGAGSINLPVQDGGIQTGDFNAVGGFFYNLDFTSNAIEVQLDDNPSDGDMVQLINYKSSLTETNSLTVNPNGNSIEDQTVNQLITKPQFVSITLQYIESEGSWYGR